eukprot:878553-Lingulodinium_polyedra.AAC.1
MGLLEPISRTGAGRAAAMRSARPGQTFWTPFGSPRVRGNAAVSRLHPLGPVVVATPAEDDF